MNTFLPIAIADISLPLWIVISQWLLLLSLGLLVIIAYRQFGYMMHLKDKGTQRDGLPIGEPAPSFNYTPVRQNGNISRYFDPKNKWSLLLFADPGCVSCQNALHALEQLLPELPQEMQILVVTSSEPMLIEAVEEFRTASVELGLVERDVPFKLYRTHSTPFTYVIDSKGIIQAKGVTGGETDIRKMIRKVDRSVVQIMPSVR